MKSFAARMAGRHGRGFWSPTAGWIIPWLHTPARATLRTGRAAWRSIQTIPTIFFLAPATASGSTNATAADSGGRVTWIFLDKGLEETVPLALVSPPTGAHLISGVGDIDGFRHDDVDVSPAEGTFAGLRFASTRDI